MKFTLYSKLQSFDFLSEAWQQLDVYGKKENSHGLSWLTIKTYKNNLKRNLEYLSSKLKSGNYSFSPLRPYIQNKNGKKRLLQIPEVYDRVVLKGMAVLLEEEYSEILQESNGVNFAYQKGRAVRDALLELKKSYISGKIILKGDIKHFFDQIPKKQLLEGCALPNLSDNSLNKLIENAINIPLGEYKGKDKDDEDVKTLFEREASKGIPQGLAISPVLANLYLLEFDRFVKGKGYKMIRYADDFIIITDSEEEAIQLYSAIGEFLQSNLFLELHPMGEKSYIVNPLTRALIFLGIEFNGIDIYPTRESFNRLKKSILLTVRKGKIDCLKEVKKDLYKWLSVYSYCDVSRYYAEIDELINKKVNKKCRCCERKILPCRNLMNRVRINQRRKSSGNIWRNPENENVLPKIYIGKKSE